MSKKLPSRGKNVGTVQGVTPTSKQKAQHHKAQPPHIPGRGGAIGGVQGVVRPAKKPPPAPPKLPGRGQAIGGIQGVTPAKNKAKASRAKRGLGDLDNCSLAAVALVLGQPVAPGEWLSLEDAIGRYLVHDAFPVSSETGLEVAGLVAASGDHAVVTAGHGMAWSWGELVAMPWPDEVWFVC